MLPPSSSSTSSRRLGRLRALQLGFGVCALSTLGFVLPLPEGAAAGWLLCLAFLQGVGIDLLWCNIYIYLVEIFPTTVRSTGFGVAMGIGRAGGIVSAAIGNVLPSMRLAFTFYAASFAGGALIALLCPAVETSRRSLTDVSRSRQQGKSATG
jgi:putative MFS transporter